VHLVDHEDLEAALHRLVDRLLQQALHLVHPPVGGGVQFGVINKTAGIDVSAGLAHATRLGRDATLPVGALAIERLGQDARHRGLAHAPGAGEQVGVVQALLGERIAQGLDHMLLPHHFGERARAVLAGQNEVGHASILSGRRGRPGQPASPDAQKEKSAPQRGKAKQLAYNQPRRAFPHGEAANRVRRGTEQP